MNPETVTIPQLWRSLTIPQWWKILLSLFSVVCTATYAGYKVGQFKIDSELNGKITELKEIVIQQEQEKDIKNSDKAQKIINKKDAEIEKLKIELSAERKKSDCYKNINAQINQLKEEKRKIKGLGFEPFTFTELTEKQAREAKEKAQIIDKLDEQLTVLYKQLGGCQN